LLNSNLCTLSLISCPCLSSAFVAACCSLCTRKFRAAVRESVRERWEMVAWKDFAEGSWRRSAEY